MKTVLVEDAVGTVLAHDLTQIIPGEFKGSRFKKGHVIAQEDIPVLLTMGKKHLYVIDPAADDVHEDDAARRIAAAAAGENVALVEKGEGKVELHAAADGLLKIDPEALERLIDDDEVMFASIHQNVVVQQGELLAGTRVIPLFVKESVVERAESIGAFVRVVPLRKMQVGLVTTGSEIYHGLIQDRFGDVLRQKFAAYGSTVMEQLFADDDDRMIADCILQLKQAGAELIAVTGGMSVDPDDRTPAGIRQAGVKVETYGAPVLPGAMFLLGYLEEVPVVGLPGCVMYHGTSVFDLVVPRLLAGEHVTIRDIKKLGHGGLCRNCAVCTYPNCGFGKG
ncbi:MAG TPA: molybdopterin-binding protein [Candidatus Agathobaculum merdigallinarum]|nr:molybdopterin-binding protein [Candidatus Agathobaculum merdigallinarum]